MLDLVIDVSINIILVFVFLCIFCFVFNIVTGNACETHGASQERQTSRVVCVGLLTLCPKTVPNVSVYRPDYLFQEQLGVSRSYPCRS